ncbi:hypothetical protein SUNI508_06548 [Seiridium unicorne]|uniref:Protection of telomeres protein 1 n=1 Tax=Seiridium unicorne TaxID=138068 RepID=A0ABR2V0E4_9PEZI
MPPYAPYGSAARTRSRPAEKELPSGVVSIRDILDEKIPVGRFTSVIGLVKDMRAPMPTNGTDWKSTLTLFDKFTEYEDGGLVFNIFRPEKDMPLPSVGDVVLVYTAKVYRWQGSALALISNRSTEITVFTASEIPRPPGSAMDAAKSTRSRGRPPTEKECEYVSWLYHATDKDMLPSVVDFQMNVERSRNIKEKFSTLKGVQEHQFCDLVVQVVKDPYDQMDKVNLWVTDYTENDAFFRFAWDGSGIPGGRDGDPYGYVSVNSDAVSRNWPGPFGKRSMQITCYEPHTSYIRGEVKAGDWIKLRNVQIKFGHNGSNLEGFLREDRSSFGSRVAIEVLDTSGSTHIDDRLKEAIRRKRDYEKTAKQQKQTFAAIEGVKRKAEDPLDDTKMNAKQRRNARRAAKNKQLVEAENKREEVLGLNDLIKCESLDEPVYPLSTILEPITYLTTIDGEQISLTLPFTNAKYRAHVRVVDYRPRKLEDFAVWRKITEYDMLSDYDGGSDSESDNDAGTLDAFAGQKTWEWCFALQLEEAGPRAGKKGPPERLWALVNNSEGQLLMDLDACDLRANPEEVSNLKEQLFKLWGNLEEYKEQESKAHIQSRRRLAANQAPPDSSDNEDGAHRQKDTADHVPVEVSNKPFTCCLRQYGIETPEPDPRKCDAGEGKRYQRMFSLFGTKIS